MPEDDMKRVKVGFEAGVKCLQGLIKPCEMCSHFLADDYENYCCKCPFYYTSQFEMKEWKECHQ